MKIEKLPDEFIAALPILEKIESAGYEAYFVGGSVRDTILGKPIHDVDIATSAFPEEVKAIFEHTVDTGIQHGTVMILDHGQGYETTTFRTESTYTDFRRPDEVHFVRSLEEDLKRRDFTINAFALQKDGEIIDMFGGLDDMNMRLLRAVGDANERFHEDALRMMRAVRFASQLDFQVEDRTLLAMKQNAALLKNIAVERINVEFTKMMQGPALRYGLLEMMRAQLHNYMPGLQDTDLDLVGYAELVGENVPQTDVEAWMLLCFELGLTDEDSASFLRTWKHSNDLVRSVKNGIKLLNALRINPPTAWQLYELGDDLPATLAVAELSELPVDVNTLAQQYAQLPIKQKSDIQLNGGQLIKELGVKPGPLMGKILNTLEKKVVAGEMVNDKATLTEAAQKMIEKEANKK